MIIMANVMKNTKADGNLELGYFSALASFLYIPRLIPIRIEPTTGKIMVRPLTKRMKISVTKRRPNSKIQLIGSQIIVYF